MVAWTDFVQNLSKRYRNSSQQRRKRHLATEVPQPAEVLEDRSLLTGEFISVVAGDGTGALENFPIPHPMASHVDAAGNTYVADARLGLVIRIAHDGSLTTLAGGGTDTTFDGDELATDLSLNLDGMAVDAAGSIYVSATNLRRILKIEANGQITVVAGGGDDYLWDGSEHALELRVGPVGDIAVDQSGTVYFSDTGQRQIVRVNPDQSIDVVAGGGRDSDWDGTEDATSLLLGIPAGLAVNNAGEVFFTDQVRSKIVKVKTNGRIQIVAGGGTDADWDGSELATDLDFVYPTALAVSETGDVLFANHQYLTKIKPDGSIELLAGNGHDVNWDGSETASDLDLGFVSTLSAGPEGSVFFADTARSRFVEVSPNGDIDIVYGGVTDTVWDGDEFAADLGLGTPAGVAIDSQGVVYFSDTTRDRIVSVDPYGDVRVVAGGGTDLEWGNAGDATALRLSHPDALAVDNQDNVYFTDAGLQSRVARLKPEGGFEIIAGGGDDTDWDGTERAPDLSLGSTSGLAVDESGHVYVTSSGSFGEHTLIIKITPDNRYEIVAGGGSDVDWDGSENAKDLRLYYSSSRHLAADTAGNVYFATTGPTRVVKIRPDGSIEFVAGGGSDGDWDGSENATDLSISNVGALAVDESGSVFFSDIDRDQIVRVDPSGSIHLLAGEGRSLLTKNGELLRNLRAGYTRGIAFGLGEIVIADAALQRIIATNSAPVITSHNGASFASISVNESLGEITTITATDTGPLHGLLRYEITGGADQHLFAIDPARGTLSFSVETDFENPTDEDSNNVYHVDVKAIDAGGLVDNQHIAVEILDVDETVIITSDGGGHLAAISLNENEALITTVTAEHTKQPSANLTYSISGGADASLFNIDASTGVVMFNEPPDFENPTDTATSGVYQVQVTATYDGPENLSDVQLISVTVADINEPPVIRTNGGGTMAAIDVKENQTAVTTVGATDPDLPAQTLSYRVSGGADAMLFSMDQTTGALQFSKSPDFESPMDHDRDGIYFVQVSVADDDDETLIDTQHLVISVSNTNENPSITSDGGGTDAEINVNENQIAVTTVVATDPDWPAQVLTYSITGGDDQLAFKINAVTGKLEFSSAPDADRPGSADGNNVYHVQVTVIEDNAAESLTAVQNITVAVEDVNEPPVLVSDGGSVATAFVEEDSVAVTIVKAIDNDLPAQSLTYELTGGDDRALFSIHHQTGELIFLKAPDFEAPEDADSDNVYHLEITASDDGAEALSVVQNLAVSVIDGLEPLVIGVVAGDGTGATRNIAVPGPDSVAVDDAGNVYIADGWHHRILKVAPDQTLSIVAGGGDDTEWDGTEDPLDLAISSRSLAVDSSGAVYFRGRRHLARVNPDGSFELIAGGGSDTDWDGSENATDIHVAIGEIATDNTGSVYFTSFGRIVRLNPGGDIDVVAGGGEDRDWDGSETAADLQLESPDGLAVDNNGNIYFIDNDYVVQVQADGNIKLLAGGGSDEYWDGSERAEELNLRLPRDVSVDSRGNVFFADYWRNRVVQINPDGSISLVAGGGFYRELDERELATDLRITPSSIAVDSGGNVVVGSVTDISPHVLKIAEDRSYEIVMGGTGVFQWNGGEQTSDLRLDGPAGVAVDSLGNVYFAAGRNSHGRLVKVDRHGAIEVLAGLGYDSLWDGSETASDLSLVDPRGVTLDDAGNLYFADRQFIVKINTNGEIDLLAGGGSDTDWDGSENATDLSLGFPQGVAVDTAGNVYFADAVRDRVVRINPDGSIDIVAGGGTDWGWDGSETATDLRMAEPYGVAVDAAGAVYFSDWIASRVVKVHPDGNIDIVAGGGDDRDWDGTETALDLAVGNPRGVAVDDAGNVYFSSSDTGGGRVVMVRPDSSIELLAGGGHNIAVKDGELLADLRLHQPTFLAIGPNGLVFSDEKHGRVIGVAGPLKMTSDGGGPVASISVEENEMDVTTIAAMSSPPRPLKYQITGGSDAHLFVVDSVTGVLSVRTILNFESPTDADADNVYLVQVSASLDGDNPQSVTQEIQVTVLDENEPPAVAEAQASVQVTENQRSVLVAKATDEDTPAQNLTYTITGGADASLFTIDPTSGALEFIHSPDFEIPTSARGDNTYDVQWSVKDDGEGQLADVQDVSVWVTDVNEEPVITSHNGTEEADVFVDENQSIVTTVSATDPDRFPQTLAYRISGGADQELFSIDPELGVLSFTSPANAEDPLDVDENNEYQVQVTVADSGVGELTDVQTIIVTVVDINESPAITSDGGGPDASIVIEENMTAVTKVTATDEDRNPQGLTYTIGGSENLELFEIDPQSGELVFKVPPDFEDPQDTNQDGIYELQVTVIDSGPEILTDVQNIRVAVIDINEPPTFTNTDDVLQVGENQLEISTLLASDADLPAQKLTYSIVGGPDAALLDVDPSGGKLSFVDSPDFENPHDSDGDNIYVASISVTDDGDGDLGSVRQVSIQVLDQNERPRIVGSEGQNSSVVFVEEDQIFVADISATDVDSSSQLLTYNLSGGEDRGLFEINSATGTLTFLSVPSYLTPTDKDGNNAYEVQVAVSDGDLSDSQAISVIVSQRPPSTPPPVTFFMDGTTSRPTFSWGDADRAESFEVWVGRVFPSPSRVLIDESIVDLSSWTPSTNLPPGFYRLWVRGINREGSPGPWSSSSTVDIKPVLVNDERATFNSRPTLEWNDIPHTSGYDIFLRTQDPIVGDIVVRNLPPSATSFVPDHDLPWGTTRWWVRSSDARFNSGWSEAGELHIRSTVIVSAGNSTISWMETSGAGRFVLHVEDAQRTVVIREDQLTGTSFSVTSQLPSGAYRVWVKAIRATTDDFTSGRWSRAFTFRVTLDSAEEHLSELTESLESKSLGTNTSTAQSKTCSDANQPHATAPPLKEIALRRADQHVIDQVMTDHRMMLSTILDKSQGDKISSDADRSPRRHQVDFAVSSKYSRTAIRADPW